MSRYCTEWPKKLSPHTSSVFLYLVFSLSFQLILTLVFYSLVFVVYQQHTTDLWSECNACAFSFIWTCCSSSEITGFVCLPHSLTCFSDLLVFEVELDQSRSRPQVKQFFPAKSGNAMHSIILCWTVKASMRDLDRHSWMLASMVSFSFFQSDNITSILSLHRLEIVFSILCHALSNFSSYGLLQS